MPDDKLKEPGAGWVNTEIELAHVRESLEPEPPLIGYLADSTKETRAWLAQLRADLHPPEEVCHRCPNRTTRRVVTYIQGTEVREHAIMGFIYECEACAMKVEIAKLKRSLYTSPYAKDLREDLRAGFAARLKELEEHAA